MAPATSPPHRLLLEADLCPDRLFGPLANDLDNLSHERALTRRRTGPEFFGMKTVPGAVLFAGSLEVAEAAPIATAVALVTWQTVVSLRAGPARAAGLTTGAWIAASVVRTALLAPALGQAHA